MVAFFFISFSFTLVLALDYDELSFLESYLIKKEGDILKFNQTKIPGMKSSALRNEDSRWPNAEVPTYFSPSYTPWEKREIIDAMLEIHNKTCVRFRRVTEEDTDFVLIVKPRVQECASMVGRQGGGQALFLSVGCFTRKVILHELMHALGFIHEHNRSDRDKYVTIKWSNIKEGEEHNFDKRKSNSLTLMDTEYSYDSIMHYEGMEFSYNKRSPTIVPKISVHNLGGGERLSSIDALRINKYYNCPQFGKEIEVDEVATVVTMPTTAEETLRPTEVPSTTSVPRQVYSTLFPPIRWSRRDCPNPYEPPVVGGNCRWLVMKVAADPNSSFHYLHCVPSLTTSDIRCGIWKRKSCTKDTVFDRTFRSCRHLKYIDDKREDSEETD